MITYTVYSEAGGVGKTTIAANLAHAHVRAGDRVLAVDLDQQNGSLTRLLGTDYGAAEDPEADDLTLHMIDRGRGPFDDLIKTTPSGVDIIPAHNRIGNLKEFYNTAEEFEQNVRQDDEYEYPRYEQLYDLLLEHRIQDAYDVVVVDPNAKADDAFLTAVYATRNLVMPVEPSGKGQLSVEGLHQTVASLEEDLGISVGVLAAVPNDVDPRVNDDGYYLSQLEKSMFDVPVAFRERDSLFRGCWRQEVTAFQYVEDHRNRKREREMETLEKFETLAQHIKETVTGESEAAAGDTDSTTDNDGDDRKLRTTPE